MLRLMNACMAPSEPLWNAAKNGRTAGMSSVEDTMLANTSTANTTITGKARRMYTRLNSE